MNRARSDFDNFAAELGEDCFDFIGMAHEVLCVDAKGVAVNFPDEYGVLRVNQ